MLNTPVAALHPTSAPMADSTKPKQPASSRSTALDDAENARKFSDYFQETNDTSQQGRSLGSTSSPSSKTESERSAGEETSDTDLANVENDAEIGNFEEAGLRVAQNPERTPIPEVSLGLSLLSGDSSVLSTRETGKTSPPTQQIAGNMTAVESGILAGGLPKAAQGLSAEQSIGNLSMMPTSADQKPALPLTPSLNPLAPPSADQVIAAQDGLQASQVRAGTQAPAESLRGAFPLSGVPSAPLATASPAPKPPLNQPVTGGQSVLESASFAATKPQDAPPAPLPTAMAAANSPSDIGNVTAGFTGTLAITSNLGQARTPSSSRRSVPDALPASADSAVKSGFSANSLSNTPTQSEATAQTFALLDNAQPSAAALEWQADAERAFDPIADLRAANSGTGIGTSRSDPVFQRPEIPRQVAAQLADIAQRMSGKSVELALNPAELGRVKLSLTPAENGMAVTITAERAETLDLMRRNIDTLAQEFRDIGYEDISFSFEQQSHESAGESQDEAPSYHTPKLEPASPQAPEPQSPYQISLSPTDRIDIRV